MLGEMVGVVSFFGNYFKVPEGMTNQDVLNLAQEWGITPAMEGIKNVCEWSMSVAINGYFATAMMIPFVIHAIGYRFL